MAATHLFLGPPPRRRFLSGFSSSLIAHFVLLLALTIVFERRDTEVPEAEGPPQLVWIAVSGDGGGGGGGGNRTLEPPRNAQRPGRDPRSVPPPPRTTPVEPVVQHAITEPSPEQVLEAPVLPQAAATLSLPGAIDGAAVSTSSLGPGTGPGAGTGDRDGIGSGRDGGLGPGSGGNAGDGPNTGGNRNLTLPIVLRDVKPQYTAEAMRARVQGAVLIRAIVQTDGTVRDAQVVRSLDPVFGLDQAAVKAASQWLFRPGLMAGVPVPVAITIELFFNLR